MTTVDAARARYDLVVVGAGVGGLTVAIGLSRAGRRVALVERGAVGGDCTNVGCIPSKALLEGAAAAGRDGARALLAEVRRLRDTVRAHDEALLQAEAPRLTLVRGSARLLPTQASRQERRASPQHVVAVEGEDGPVELRAGRVVLATGSSPVHVDVAGLAPAAALSNETVFELERAPRVLAVLGGGAMGCELALAFARLGSTVHVIEARGRLLSAFDADAATLVRQGLEHSGVRVHTGVQAQRLEGARLELRGEGGSTTIEGVDRVLMACGRRPNVDGLGLDRAGVRVRDGAIATDGGHRTSRPGVFAIGDVTGRVASTHAAHTQARRLVRRFLLPLPLLPEGPYPEAVFTAPEVARVGPSVEELRARHGRLLAVHRIALADTDRGRVMGLDGGYLEVCALRFSGRVLAGSVVGPGATELILPLTRAVRSRERLWRLSTLVAVYPTLGEALRLAADAFVFAALPRLPRELGLYLAERWRRRPPAS